MSNVSITLEDFESESSIKESLLKAHDIVHTIDTDVVVIFRGEKLVIHNETNVFIVWDSIQKVINA